MLSKEDERLIITYSWPWGKDNGRYIAVGLSV
jgi:hypothetical protein